MRRTCSKKSHNRLRHLTLATTFLVLAGCGAPGASAERISGREVAEIRSASNTEAFGSSLTPAEVRYVRQTASTIYRGQSIERTRDFLASDGSGYRICVRAHRKGVRDHTLLTLQRRITEEVIPQAADDVLIQTSSAATAICRDPRNAWIALR